VCAYVDIRTNEFRGVHRTWLTSDAQKIDRASLGPTKGATIKIDADDEVTDALAIAEGVETAIAGRYLYRPAWSVISAGGMRDFPVLSGIEHLEIFADNDASKTGEQAAWACLERWENAGAEASITMPPTPGTDIADIIAMRKVY
jgi:putative DNA primase/helicase